MATFGKLQAALAAATNEVTLAAANINFDFTLFKMEAPQEFNILGSALSKSRKENAEFGSIHITARRLGALFNDLSPPTPNLIKAYGNRVSEIAQEAKQANEPEVENSMFAAHSGVDGTSIWAAATSSHAALHVQLLACMLSRLWGASEAVSVWFELVKERKRDIEVRYAGSETLPYSTVAAAAQAEISRASLAEWDASARSWLRTADQVKIKQQDQLMSLLAKVNVPINRDTDVYQSVITAWKCALDSMENLLAGMPQAANNGPCLLALSSWHIYPDTVLMTESSILHRFQDPLVQSGGILTLGLAYPGGVESQGVFWSLSLAHLNYYGRPVSREARLNIQSRRLTFDQFTQTVFGALLGHWDLLGPMADHPTQFFVSTRNALQRAADSPRSNDSIKDTCLGLLRDQSNGVNIMMKVANQYLETKDFKDELIHKLIAFGGKRAPQLIPAVSHHRTFFGFNDPRTTLSLLKGPEERIRFLRQIASNSESYRGFLFIKYIEEDPKARRLCGLASAHAHTPHDQNPESQEEVFHSRWAPSLLLHNTAPENELTSEMTEEASLFYASHYDSFQITMPSSGAESHIRTYKFAFGDENSAAIYIDQDMIRRTCSNGQDPSLLLPPITIKELIWCLESDMFAMDKLAHYFSEGPYILSPLGQTLSSLSVAHTIYRSLPDATISTRALNSPLYLTEWSRHASRDPKLHRGGILYRNTDNRPREIDISQEIALSCVAYMEGGFDIKPVSFKTVFAIAYEDSIYVSMQLMCDPWVVPNPCELRRIVGNIGKPGLTMLIPPKEPILSSQQDSSWHVISDREFDGTPENHFSKSSIHLSFTAYYVPFAQFDDTQGHQDSQVYLLESVVSVYYSGEWIGDVDVLQCLNSSLITRLPEGYCNMTHDDPFALAGGALSVESWVDIIDPPNRTCVIRAHGSFLARLATTVIFIQGRLRQNESDRSNGICVLPEKFCWMCCGPSRLPSDFLTPGTVRIPGLGKVMLY